MNGESGEYGVLRRGKSRTHLRFSLPCGVCLFEKESQAVHHHARVLVRVLTSPLLIPTATATATATTTIVAATASATATTIFIEFRKTPNLRVSPLLCIVLVALSQVSFGSPNIYCLKLKLY